MEFKDDIVAISSPPGMGAISIIRVSGPNAIKKTSFFLNLPESFLTLNMLDQIYISYWN